MSEQAADAVDDGQAKAGTALLAVVQAAEFLEDLALQRIGDAGALVVHFDPQQAFAATAAQKHATALAVAQRVGQEILQDAAQQRFIADHHRIGIDPVHHQATRLRGDAEFARQCLQQRPEPERLHTGRQAARFQPRDIQQTVEDRILRGQCSVDVIAGLLLRRVAQLAAQHRDEHACCVEWLQQVVHGRGDEAGLVAVGLFGLAACFVQVVGTFGDAVFQCIGQRAQFACSILVAGDVGVAGDETAVGQRVAADFQHRTVVLLTFAHVRTAAAQMVQATLDGLVDRAGTEQATACVEAEQFLDGPPHAH